jgi:glycerophosphoryl diester phosphodiesterase
MDMKKKLISLLTGTLLGCGLYPPAFAANLPTLDGKPPLVIGHRGFAGMYPEETAPAYDAAVTSGADSLEMDLHLTKDCVLVARHNPWLSDNTNIAEVAKTNPQVAARKRTIPGVRLKVAWPTTADSGPGAYLTDLTDPHDPKSVLKSLIVDGEDHTNDWAINDFTLAELKQWIRGTTFDDRNERPTALNGQYPILTFQEVINIAKAGSKATGRVISVYPEAKNPLWNDEQAIAHGCGPAGSHPLEDAMLKVINQNDLNSKTAPIFVQSFDPASLKYMRSKGLSTKVVQLIDGNGINYETGAVIYNTGGDATFVDGRPWSWTIGGKPDYFGAMLTPAGMAEIKTYADAIGPWKPEVMTFKIMPWPDKSSDGKPYVGSLAAVNDIQPNNVISDAHKAGLLVHVYTFRNEKKYLAGFFHGDPRQEYLQFFRAGVDGVFTDFAITASEARTAYLNETGY